MEIENKLFVLKSQFGEAVASELLNSILFVKRFFNFLCMAILAGGSFHSKCTQNKVPI